MSRFILNKVHLQITSFHLKKRAADSYQLLQEAYGDHALLQDMCELRFWHFKNGVYHVADKEHGRPKKK